MGKGSMSKQYTLDKILDWQSSLIVSQSIVQSISKTKKMNLTLEMIEEAKNKAKQQIAQAIEDAKPEKFKFDDGQNDATHFYNKAVSEYQQNLLKALSKETSQETQDD